MLMIAVAVLAVAALLLRVLLGPGMQRYELLDVVTKPGAQRHALVFRHQDGDAAVTGIWLTEGTAPGLGGREAPTGRPVAIWFAGHPRIAWQGEMLRLIGPYGRVLGDADRVASCPDRDAPGAPWELCFDPARVTFVPLPR